MAGIFLPLQHQHTHQSLKRFQHATKAAAAVEQETEEGGKPEPEAEEPNDNTIVETGAELGNVQTPASVWLPYATNQNGKVSSPTVSYSTCKQKHKLTRPTTQSFMPTAMLVFKVNTPVSC